MLSLAGLPRLFPAFSVLSSFASAAFFFFATDWPVPPCEPASAFRFRLATSLVPFDFGPPLLIGSEFRLPGGRPRVLAILSLLERGVGIDARRPGGRPRRVAGLEGPERVGAYMF